MNLSFLIERGSTWIVKLGMPLVYAYHLICGNSFLNIAAEDAEGLDKVANYALSPWQYLFDGKKAILYDEEQHLYHFEPRFNYQNHFFIKTAASVTALPFSLLIGGTLKTLAQLSPQSATRYASIVHSLATTVVHSHLDEYRHFGLEVNDFRDAELIKNLNCKRPTEDLIKLKDDIEALKDVVRILSKHHIPFWVDCGTCLGAYRYGGVIPWDWDLDIGILENDFENVKNALNELDTEQYMVQDWSGRDKPKTYLKVYIKKNGGMIDIYNFRIDVEKKEIATVLSNEFNIFLPSSWKIREKRYTVPMPYQYIFPLKKAKFEGFEVPVPGNIEKYLQKFYGENLAPARIYNEETKSYEKDLSHPYWQLPYAL